MAPSELTSKQINSWCPKSSRIPVVLFLNRVLGQTLWWALICRLRMKMWRLMRIIRFRVWRKVRVLFLEILFIKVQIDLQLQWRIYRQWDNQGFKTLLLKCQQMKSLFILKSCSKKDSLLKTLMKFLTLPNLGTSLLPKSKLLKILDPRAFQLSNF